MTKHLWPSLLYTVYESLDASESFFSVENHIFIDDEYSRGWKSYFLSKDSDTAFRKFLFTSICTVKDYKEGKEFRVYSKSRVTHLHIEQI
jgi:hypothetical protein